MKWLIHVNFFQKENDTVKADFFWGGGIDSFTFLMVLYVGDSKITILRYSYDKTKYNFGVITMNNVINS